MAVRWYLRHPLSATSVMELLAERGIDASDRTVLRWVQAFGPPLAAEARKHRRQLGRCWYTDEMFFFGGKDKWYLYRAVDERGQVVDVLLREHRETASAEALFAQALGRSGQVPRAIITDHHQPYIKAIQRTVPTAVHIRSGLHRVTGETTKPIERSHVPTRDRLRASEVAIVGRHPDLRRSANVAAATSMGYCMKCKAQREIKAPKQITMKNGRPAIEGSCQVCGTRIFKIGTAK